ncbi:MAG: gliding motility-associated C-terminal domain-containing protein, partial [Saprospiraceae bacterium]|nr:gliding motility-associated C-terminal domain-containing protein [Saprospiraceae bacterium]
DTAGDPFIPEIYTPNGDGQNDNWLVVMPDGVEKGEYTIFNRLGGKVYEGDTLTPWDGTGCPDGAYFYVLRYAQNDREVVKKGAITIIRTSR